VTPTVSRISPVAALAMFVLAACASAPTVTESPELSSAAPVAGSPPAFALNRAPADLGCDSIGWPDDVPPFHALTFKIDPAADEPVSARSDTGVELETWWVPGFEPGESSERVVRGPDGQVVARDGEVVVLPPRQNAKLHGYPLCVTPTTLSVMLPNSG
jgi:hypothetical protein